MEYIPPHSSRLFQPTLMFGLLAFFLFIFSKPLQTSSQFFQYTPYLFSKPTQTTIPYFFTRVAPPLKQPPTPIISFFLITTSPNAHCSEVSLNNKHEEHWRNKRKEWKRIKGRSGWWERRAGMWRKSKNHETEEMKRRRAVTWGRKKLKE